MHPLMSLVAASAVSISAGWTRLPDGNYEYIIQIEPEAIASLVDGEEFISEVPPDAREVRSYRVRVGRQPLPRESGPLTAAIGPPPADTTLNLGPPPDAAQAAPNFGAPPAAPEITHRPPAAEPRHVGIHAEEPKGGDATAPPACHETDKVSAPSGAGPSAQKTGGEGEEPVKKMWAPLFGALLALFASVGGNVFLGWTAVNMRGRYKALLAHQQLA